MKNVRKTQIVCFTEKQMTKNMVMLHNADMA